MTYSWTSVRNCFAGILTCEAPLESLRQARLMLGSSSLIDIPIDNSPATHTGSLHGRSTAPHHADE
jgi:hypothetical protein